MFIIIVKYIIIVHCYRRIIACKFTDYPALRSPAHHTSKYLSSTIAPPFFRLTFVPYTQNIYTFHLIRIYLSIEKYSSFI